MERAADNGFNDDDDDDDDDVWGAASVSVVCNQASLGVAAIFGPRSPSIASYINSMCNTLEVPHVEARLDSRSGAGHVFSLNVYPQAAQLGRVYLDLLDYFGWTKFCVVYGEHSG